MSAGESSALRVSRRPGTFLTHLAVVHDQPHLGVISLCGESLGTAVIIMPFHTPVRCRHCQEAVGARS